MPWVIDPLGASALARDSAERAFPSRGGQLIAPLRLRLRRLSPDPRTAAPAQRQLRSAGRRFRTARRGCPGPRAPRARLGAGRRRAHLALAAAFPGAAGHVSTAPHLVLGRAAEAAAARFLERRGYRILNDEFPRQGRRNRPRRAGRRRARDRRGPLPRLRPLRRRRCEHHAREAQPHHPRRTRTARQEPATGETPCPLRRRRSQRPRRRPELQPHPRCIQPLAAQKVPMEAVCVT